MNSTIADSLPSTGDIIEALGAVAHDYGLRWDVDEQVVVARSLRAAQLTANRGRFVNHKDIAIAFERFRIEPPPRGFAKAVVARLHRLYGPWPR